ncbi:peptide chain release factor N(5)-glutamine methyltransferase [bacterium]|nr:peptide chain release factor N(5)-glutamine methyltransferase [bacterium]
MGTSTDNQSWRLIDVLKEAAGFLNARGIDNARPDAERLLAHILGLSRVDLYLQFEKPLSTGEREAYKERLRRRAAHEPLQYILGGTEFMSLDFLLNPGVLIPRPETEILVEKSMEIAALRLKNLQPIHILDIGTGSGCIAVSLAVHLQQSHIHALDRESEALDLAKKNAVLHGVDERITFSAADIRTLEAPPDNTLFDLIVSNPPYIRTGDIPGLAPEIAEYEPVQALDGGTDGLDFYRRFQILLPAWLGPQGAAVLEIGADQGAEVRNIFQQGPWASVEIVKDLAGLDRVAVLLKGI